MPPMGGDLDVVTGAFSHTGRYIAAELLAAGRRVRTLTRDPARPSPFGAAVQALPLRFDQPDDLARALDGADTLYNTYWQRFAHGRATFDLAIQNTETLVAAAVRAGVRRIVQISITHADPASPLPYFRGKGLAENAVRGSGLGYGIVRPAVLFGPQGIVLEQVAWLCRHLPVFAVFGTGGYPVQPVHVGDLAALAVRAGRAEADSVSDAVGPERYTFEELVRTVGAAVGRVPPIVHLPPRAVAWAGAVGGVGPGGHPHLVG